MSCFLYFIIYSPLAGYPVFLQGGISTSVYVVPSLRQCGGAVASTLFDVVFLAVLANSANGTRNFRITVTPVPDPLPREYSGFCVTIYPLNCKQLNSTPDDIAVGLDNTNTRYK